MKINQNKDINNKKIVESKEMCYHLGTSDCITADSFFTFMMCVAFRGKTSAKFKPSNDHKHFDSVEFDLIYESI